MDTLLGLLVIGFAALGFYCGAFLLNECYKVYKLNGDKNA